MLYLKIGNTVIEFSGFQMTYYQRNQQPRFSGALSSNQDMSALSAISNGTVIHGITLYQDAECTERYWSNNSDFVLEQIGEGYTYESPTLTRYFDLVVC